MICLIEGVIMSTQMPTIPTISAKKELYLRKHPYDRNVFIMMKYSEDEYHTLVERNVRKAFKGLGFFNAVFAKDLTPEYFPTLLDAIRESIDMCPYGIAIFTPQEGTQFNPNVAFEMGIMSEQKKKGIMLEQKKEILLLKDRRVPTLFTNIAGLVYKGFDGDLEDLGADANQLYTTLTKWLREMKELQEASLNVVFVTGLENIIENPARAIEYFEEQMWRCIKTIAEYAHINLPQSDDLRKAIKFLYHQRQITAFIRFVMLECVRSCQELREFKQLSVEQRNQLLGWASLIRDIYNDWLRYYSDYLRLKKQ
jgi:hypothetical protein